MAPSNQQRQELSLANNWQKALGIMGQYIFCTPESKLKVGFGDGVPHYGSKHVLDCNKIVNSGKKECEQSGKCHILSDLSHHIISLG